MEKEFLTNKIKTLTNDKLIDLLQLLKNGNPEIISWVQEEAVKRGINLQTIPTKEDHFNKSSIQNAKEEATNWWGVVADFLTAIK